MIAMQLEDGVEVEVNNSKYMYASDSLIEGSYFQHKDYHEAAVKDGWIAYKDVMGFRRYKKPRSTPNVS